MAITVTPQNLGRDGTSLTMKSGEDPTYVEVPRVPIMVIVAGIDTSDRSISVAPQKNIGNLSRTITQFQETTSFGSNIIEEKTPYYLIVKPRLSEAILDETNDPPRIEITGSDLTNCKIGAFEFNIF